MTEAVPLSLKAATETGRLRDFIRQQAKTRGDA